jgi:hypothetical protein
MKAEDFLLKSLVHFVDIVVSDGSNELLAINKSKTYIMTCKFGLTCL